LAHVWIRILDRLKQRLRGEQAPSLEGAERLEADFRIGAFPSQFEELFRNGDAPALGDEQTLSRVALPAVRAVERRHEFRSIKLIKTGGFPQSRFRGKHPVNAA